MSGPFLIALARSEHLQRIRELELEAFGFTWEEKIFEKELERPNGCLAILTDGVTVIGSALLVWAADEVQLNSLVIDRAYRGKGLSKTFLGRLMAWCQKRDFAWFTLEVKWNNPPALSLYTGLGFVTTARRKNYYRDGQDARIMWAGHLQCASFYDRLAPYVDDALELERAA